MNQRFSKHLQKSPCLVLLDRDGVINHDSESYIKNISEWSPIDGSITAIVKLQLSNINVAVCTNQSGLSRGLIQKADLLSIHESCNQKLVEAGGHSINFFFCPHLPTDSCGCRKPLPGLLKLAMSVFAVKSGETIFLGDSITDVYAAEACNVDFALVVTGNGSNTLKELGVAESSSIRCHDYLAGYVDSLML